MADWGPKDLLTRPLFRNCVWILPFYIISMRWASRNEVKLKIVCNWFPFSIEWSLIKSIIGQHQFRKVLLIKCFLVRPVRGMTPTNGWISSVSFLIRCKRKELSSKPAARVQMSGNKQLERRIGAEKTRRLKLIIETRWSGKSSSLLGKVGTY